MIDYIKNNFSTVIISLLLLIVVIAIIRRIHNNRGMCDCGKKNCSAKNMAKNLKKIK